MSMVSYIYSIPTHIYNPSDQFLLLISLYQTFVGEYNQIYQSMYLHRIARGRFIWIKRSLWRKECIWGMYLFLCYNIASPSRSYLTHILYSLMHLQVINHIHVLAKHASKMADYKGPILEQEDHSKTRNLFSASIISDPFQSLIQENDSQVSGITITLLWYLFRFCSHSSCWYIPVISLLFIMKGACRRDRRRTSKLG